MRVVVRRLPMPGLRQILVPMIDVLVTLVASRVRLLVAVRMRVLVAVRVTVHHVSVAVLMFMDVTMSVLMLLRRVRSELLFHNFLPSVGYERPGGPRVPERASSPMPATHLEAWCRVGRATV